MGLIVIDCSMPKVIARKRLSYSYDIIDVREINSKRSFYEQ